MGRLTLRNDLSQGISQKFDYRHTVSIKNISTVIPEVKFIMGQ